MEALEDRLPNRIGDAECNRILGVGFGVDKTSAGRLSNCL